MKSDRLLRPATDTSWVVSYGGKTIQRWRTAAILKIDISPYLSEKSSNFDEILYTAADFELDEHHVIKNEKVTLDGLRVRQNVFFCGKIQHAVSHKLLWLAFKNSTIQMQMSRHSHTNQKLIISV